MIKIKVNYDPQTSLVKGYYPDSIEYSSIPEPFVEIDESDQILNKQMCVIDGVYQEYVEPESVLLERARREKLAQCRAYLASTDWQIIRLSDPSSSEPLKQGVAENRALARSLQDKISACKTLKELNAIQINFE
jgi:hypothetical protein